MQSSLQCKNVGYVIVRDSLEPRQLFITDGGVAYWNFHMDIDPDLCYPLLSINTCKLSKESCWDGVVIALNSYKQICFNTATPFLLYFMYRRWE